MLHTPAEGYRRSQEQNRFLVFDRWFTAKSAVVDLPGHSIVVGLVRIVRLAPRKLVVMPLRNTPDAARVAALAAAIAGREEVAAVGTTLFAVYPDGVGRSKLTTALIEKTLGTRGTGRNFDTARKIETAALALNAA